MKPHITFDKKNEQDEVHKCTFDTDIVKMFIMYRNNYTLVA